MSRHKDADWSLSSPVKSWEEVHAALLMDIRDELKGINRRLSCHETLAMPRYLRLIAKNTAKRPAMRRRIAKRIGRKIDAVVAMFGRALKSINANKKKKKRGLQTRKLS